MDLCSMILSEMMTAVEDMTLRGALPFGKMVTEMCQMHEVDFDPRDDVVRGMAPIDGGTLKRSRSARVAQREGGQGQEEEDEEREELMALEGGGGGSHTQGSGSSQGEDPSLKTLMEQLQINHQLVMHRLDQQDAQIKELMRRYPPPPP